MQSGVFTEDDKPNIKKFYTLRKLSLHINPTILLNLQTFSHSQLMNLVYLILSLKNVGNRTTMDTQIIFYAFKDLDFFQKLINLSVPQSKLNYICESIGFKMCEPNEIIVKKGQYHDQFYVILRGEFETYQPTKRVNGVLVEEVIKRLGVGKCFGAVPIISDAPHQSTIRSTQDCILGVIKKDIFETLSENLKKKNLDIMIEFIKSLQLFQFTSRQTIENILFQFQKVTVNRGNILCKEGVQAEYVYLIFSGEFMLEKELVQRREIESSMRKREKLKMLHQSEVKKQIKVATLSSGEMFGEVDCLLNQPYHFTVTCMSSLGEVYAITSRNFRLKIIENNANHQVVEFIEKYLHEKVESRKQRIQTIWNTIQQKKCFIRRPLQDKSLVADQSFSPFFKKSETPPLQYPLQSQDKKLPRASSQNKSKYQTLNNTRINSQANNYLDDSLMHAIEDSYKQRVKIQVMKKLLSQGLVNQEDQKRKEAKIRRDRTYSIDFMKKNLEKYASNISAKRDSSVDKSKNQSQTIEIKAIPRNINNSFADDQDELYLQQKIRKASYQRISNAQPHNTRKNSPELKAVKLANIIKL